MRFITRITRPTSENGGKVKSEEGVCSEVTVYALSEDKKFLAEGKNLAHRSFSQTSPCAQKASNGLLIEKRDNKLQSDKSPPASRLVGLLRALAGATSGTHSRSTRPDENAGALAWSFRSVCSDKLN